jgi:YHS domain-containing protein
VFRQTILVAACLLGVACLVLGEETPSQQRPRQQPTYRRKTNQKKTRQQKPSPVTLGPKVTMHPGVPLKTPPPPVVGSPSADDKDKKSEGPRPTGTAVSGNATGSGQASADARNGRDEAAATVMPTKVVDEAERQLYLTPGGKYSAEDIKANGNLTAGQKYAGFKAKHDRDPKPGDRICPITDTKANPKCTWVIGGKTYSFCCPPCIDEFVRLAKENPDKVKNPDEYVQK